MIGVYDSGLGGLTVLPPCATLRSATMSSTSPIKRTCRTATHDADLHGLLTTNLGGSKARESIWS